MAIRLQPGQGRGEEKDNDSKSNSQNYEGDNVTQNTKTITAIDSASQDSASNKKIKIIIDEPVKEGALDFQDYSRSLANIIRETTTPQFAVGIFGTWGSGKTTLMKMIQQELDKDNEKVLTVWFDAWRYEREKHLAVIPFLRQIRIALDKNLAEKGKNGKSRNWKKVRRGVDRTLTAFIESFGPSIAPAGSPVSATFNPGNFVNSLKSKGSTWIHNERIQFQEHITDYLRDSLDNFEQENPGSRIVVFVDDLDRCTPEKALEVLESIKAFFDIKGIVYVVGMDSESIDHIIKEKYGKDAKINGMDYLEKIVQLPFQIPIWRPEDITGSIEKIISKELEDSKHAKEFEQERRKSLIVKAIEPNPRQVKRFVNNIILANEVFGKDIDKLIVVQALHFRSEWNRFLELISADDELRKTFFREYYGRSKNEVKLKDLLKNLKEKPDVYIALPKEIKDIFQEFLNQQDDALKSFLDAGADKILQDIETMEDYRRALKATKLKQEEKELMGKQAPTKKFLLELLRKGRIEVFNDVLLKHPLFSQDLSYADLTGAKLSGAKLSGAKLMGASFSEADLTFADLTGANLSFADLTFAKLSGAKLSDADLRDADLRNANLRDADLRDADLTGANLSFADLTGAKLSDADLRDADLRDAKLSLAELSFAELIGANLTGANLRDANLTGANLSDAKLSLAELIGANLSDAKLSLAELIGANLRDAKLSFAELMGANLSDADLSGATLQNSIIIGARYTDNYPKCVDADFKDAIIDDENLTMRLSSNKNTKNVPLAVKNKTELLGNLEERGFSRDVIGEFLSRSSLPD